MAWHNDDHAAAIGNAAYSMAVGIYTDYPVVADVTRSGPIPISC